MTPSETCQGCGQKIDPKFCHCGDPINSHHEHLPVPMGCLCHLVLDEEKWWLESPEAEQRGHQTGHG